jgi:plastocyanin
VPTRRALLEAGGLWLAGLAAPATGRARGQVVEIRMRSDDLGAHVAFEPIGLLIRPGQTIRWVNAGNNVHTTTAYHPDNDDHPLRIPERARPWDSGYLIHPGDRFELTLTVEGVYDYYCTPHEMAGMVGRIIVGRPAGGPGTLPFDYFQGNPAKRHWRSVPPAARRAFPAIDLIIAQGVVLRS